MFWIARCCKNSMLLLSRCDWRYLCLWATATSPFWQVYKYYQWQLQPFPFGKSISTINDTNLAEAERLHGCNQFFSPQWGRWHYRYRRLRLLRSFEAKLNYWSFEALSLVTSPIQQVPRILFCVNLSVSQRVVDMRARKKLGFMIANFFDLVEMKILEDWSFSRWLQELKKQSVTLMQPAIIYHESYIRFRLK
jgi:hypothetical protein